MEFSPPLTSVLSALTLSVFVAAWLGTGRAITLPRVSKTRLAFFGGWLALAYLLWVSDYPAVWRLPELINYLAEPTLAAFRILCVTATGAVIFGSAVALLFWAGRKRR